MFADEIDWRLAECHQHLEDASAEIVVYRRLLDSESASYQARLQLARALADAGNIEAALRELKPLRTSPDVALAIAQLLIRRNLQRPADEQNWSEIESMLTTADKTDGDAIVCQLLWAAVWQGRGQADRAQQVLEQATERWPQEPIVLRSVAEFYLRQGEPDSVEPLLWQLLDPAAPIPDRQREWASRQLEGSASNKPI